MSVTAKVYCMVIILIALFMFGMCLFIKACEHFIDKIFADHDKQVELILSQKHDDSYTTAYVDCLTEAYILGWMHSSTSDVKCGDSVFAYLIQDEAYLELLYDSKSRLFHRKRNKENLIVNLAVRNHDSYDFERIHSITCRSISPELAPLEHHGVWFSYDASLVS